MNSSIEHGDVVEHTVNGERHLGMVVFGDHVVDEEMKFVCFIDQLIDPVIVENVS